MARLAQRWAAPSLLIDTANQLTPGLKPHESVQSWLERSAAGVRAVMALAAQAGLQPVFVAESPHREEPALRKFRTRHEKKLRQGRAFTPYGSELLVCELALRAGALVVCDERHEADTIAASYCLRSSPESRVLSRDSDYLRYDGGALRGRVVHARVVAAVLSGTRLELLPTPLPAALEEHHGLETLAGFAPPFASSAAALAHRRSTSDTIVRAAAWAPAERYGGRSSLLLAARPLRRALYASAVREVFPTWDALRQRVMWIDELVMPHDADGGDAGVAPVAAAPAAAAAAARPRAWCAAQIARRLLDDVGGAHDAQHAEAAMLVGCELAARANQSSMLSEWEGACSDGRHATAPSLRSVPMAPSVT